MFRDRLAQFATGEVDRHQSRKTIFLMRDMRYVNLQIVESAQLNNKSLQRLPADLLRINDCL